MAIVAPTGVAAINAGGVTIHSLFQLPFGAFLPTSNELEEHTVSNFYNRQSLLKHLRLNKDKRELLQELDLLIIDEVSMVRADLLDAIDTVLKHVRRKPYLPFGGVQMLFIGDLFQLPPVVKDDDWRILQSHYSSPFFFHARALQDSPPLYLELKKIYRQSDEDFINLLNNLRNSVVTEEDLQLLDKHYKPGFKPEAKGEYIILTTHNSKADVINQKELDLLPDPLHSFEASLEGIFNENALPAEQCLQLKQGAQIMFTRNDKGEIRRFYNGKIGTISRIKNDEIFVTFPDQQTEMLVEKETWQNVRYKYNKETDDVEEEVLGTFSQYPLRLAWAITIHKSQGLTFEKAIIDAGASFAAGQVYVALSRLTSLEGLVLLSPIHRDCVSTDMEAINFSKTEPEERVMVQQLKEAQKQYIYNSILEGFDWTRLITHAENFRISLEDRRMPVLKQAIALADKLQKKLQQQEKTANTFIKQLKQLLPTAEVDAYHQVYERVKAAEKYFCNALHEDLFKPLEEHYEFVKKQSKVKKYLKEIQSIIRVVKTKKHQIEQVVFTTEGLTKGTDPLVLLEQMKTEEKAKTIQLATEEKQIVKNKPAKGESHRISLALFKGGKSIEDIAEERNLAIGTIEGHLASFVSSGELDIELLVTKEKMDMIRQVIDSIGHEPSASEVKEKLGDEFSYGEVRAVISYVSPKTEK